MYLYSIVIVCYIYLWYDTMEVQCTANKAQWISKVSIKGQGGAYRIYITSIILYYINYLVV